MRNEIALIGIDQAQQLSDALGVSGGRVVLALRRRYRINETACGITGSPAGGDCIPEHLPAVLVRTMCCVNCAARFDPAKHSQQLGWSNFADRP
jgi:hypothetical protein